MLFTTKKARDLTTDVQVLTENGPRPVSSTERNYWNEDDQYEVDLWVAGGRYSLDSEAEIVVVIE